MGGSMSSPVPTAANNFTCKQLADFADVIVDFSVALPAAGPQRWASLEHERVPRPPTHHPATPRLLSLGDLHGDYAKTRDALRTAGIVDANDHWAAGRSTVVQVGDQLDRGGDEIAIMLLLERLRLEALKVGGAFYAINGNHETLNVASFFRYVEDPEGFEDFQRWQGWFRFGERIKRNCGIAPVKLGRAPSNLPEKSYARYRALRPGGPLAKRFLSTQNTVMTIGSSLFVHGGILPDHLVLGFDTINDVTSAWMRGEVERMPRFLSGRNAVVWCRQFSHPNKNDCSLLESVLNQSGYSRMIMGHTIQPNGISDACRGQALRIDVGISKGCGDGESQVLEILNDTKINVITKRGIVTSFVSEKTKKAAVAGA
eukprot:m.94383 g.94383  ORF g.94383 m.94383 type:complete len:372 (-) comp13442_c0_seq4:36-1151(-)